MSADQNQAPAEGDVLDFVRKFVTYHYTDEPEQESLIDEAWRILQCDGARTLARSDELNEKAGMPHSQALELAISEGCAANVQPKGTEPVYRRRTDAEALDCANRLNRSFPPSSLKDEAADHIRELVAVVQAPAPGDAAIEQQPAEPEEDLQTRLDLYIGWHADDEARMTLLEQHLRGVLEIAGTWEPDYATKMDKDTLRYARECLTPSGSTLSPRQIETAPVGAISEVIRISDRSHPAWDEVKAWLASAKQTTVSVPAGYKLLGDGKTMVPEDWTTLSLEWDPGYPEDVAFGPQRMMVRLKKWLDRHFAARVAETQAPAVGDRPEAAGLAEARDEGWRAALESAARICDATPPSPFRPSIEAAHAIRQLLGPKPRCTLCGYQHGHAIGCERNPVDLALQAASQPPVQGSQS